MKHPGQHLREILNERGMNQKAFVALSGVSRSRLSEVLRGKRSITPLLAIRLEGCTAVDADGWMALQASHDLRKARRKLHPDHCIDCNDKLSVLRPDMRCDVCLVVKAAELKMLGHETP